MKILALGFKGSVFTIKQLLQILRAVALMCGLVYLGSLLVSPLRSLFGFLMTRAIVQWCALLTLCLGMALGGLLLVVLLHAVDGVAYLVRRCRGLPQTC